MARSRSPRRRATPVDLRAAAEEAYSAAAALTGGSIYNCQDVPGLSDVADAEQFVVTFLLVDGTSFTLPSQAPQLSETWFLTQSTFKPLVYAMALENLGVSTTHRSVGSAGGLGYGAFEVLPDGRAPNPLINSGALTLLEKLRRQHSEEAIAEFCCTLGDPELVKVRAQLGTERWFDNIAVKATEADSIRNRGLCCFLSTRPADGTAPLPKDEQAIDTAVRLYCMADCLKTNTAHLARIAAIFSNGGYEVGATQEIRLLSTGAALTASCCRQLLSADAVRMTLSQMLSAGMYEASGDWSREVGIPAKSGVSGAIMCVIPSVAGIGIYSPKIDKQGNSVRGMAFVRELVKRLPELNMFHIA